MGIQRKELTGGAKELRAAGSSAHLAGPGSMGRVYSVPAQTPPCRSQRNLFADIVELESDQESGPRPHHGRQPHRLTDYSGHGRGQVKAATHLGDQNATRSCYRDSTLVRHRFCLNFAKSFPLTPALAINLAESLLRGLLALASDGVFEDCASRYRLTHGASQVL